MKAISSLGVRIPWTAPTCFVQNLKSKREGVEKCAFKFCGVLDLQVQIRTTFQKIKNKSGIFSRICRFLDHIFPIIKLSNKQLNSQFYVTDGSKKGC